jgi:hypothetical protein
VETRRACITTPHDGALAPLSRSLPSRSNTGYVVRDATGQIIAWVYARASTAEAMQAKVPTLTEARRVATNIARLPELLRRDDPHLRFVGLRVTIRCRHLYRKQCPPAPPSTVCHPNLQ